MKSAHAVNAAEREFETLRFMCSEERGIFRRSAQKECTNGGQCQVLREKFAFAACTHLRRY